MPYALQLTKSEQLTLDAAVADRLIASGNGDAALLYLCLLRHNGQLSEDAALRELHFTQERRRAAEEGLRRLGLLGEAVPLPERETQEAAPAYSQTDVAEALEQGGEFALLSREIARKLGKPSLTTAECRSLLQLYDYLSLPAEVIFALVQHCIDEYEARCGAGRRPTMRMIEKEGFFWHKTGVDTAKRAEAYLRERSRRAGKYPAYMEVLRLTGRRSAPSEEKYMDEWLEMGFPPETVALAYDRTVLKCHELKWGYLTAILRRWHARGWHTAEEVRQGDAPAAKRTETKNERDEKMKEYVRKAYGGGESDGR